MIRLALGILLVQVGFGCQPVEGPLVRARDFAAVVPAFSTLSPETEIAPAPLAGVRRVVSPLELRRIADKFRLTLDSAATGACFEQALAKLDAADLLPILKAVLPGDGVRIEILDFMKAPVPHGRLEFVRGGLEPSGMWHGRVTYGPGRSVIVWAKVRAVETRTWVEAAEVLPVGKPIAVDSVVLRSGERSLLEKAPLDSLDGAVDRKPLRTLAPGAVLFAALLSEVPQVARGDRVTVEVSRGGALLAFDAEAETSGRVGDVVFLRNPESGRRFEARVEAKGKVAIRK
jgi:flagella basal body P-ring formation protein FlgA